MKSQAFLLGGPCLFIGICLMVYGFYLDTGKFYQKDWSNLVNVRGNNNGSVSPGSLANYSWMIGLSLPFEFEAFHNSIRDYVETENNFPWHLVDNETLFGGKNILEYVKEHAIRGDPFHPLYSEYRSPCWIQSKTPRSSVIDTRTAKTVTSLACMPYFFEAGFPKSGTTDFYQKLSSHPDVPKTYKEKFYWSTKTRDFRRYVNECFDAKTYKQIVNNVVKTGNTTFHPSALVDGTPATIWRKAGPDKKYTSAVTLRAILPNAKFIVLIRNPTARSISHFRHFRSNKSPEFLYKFMIDSVAKYKECIRKKGIQHCIYGLGSDEVRASLYYAHLNGWLSVFPRTSFFFIKSEEYYKNELLITNQAFDFLGLERISPTLAPYKRNKRIWPGNYSEEATCMFLKKTKLLLDEFYRPINEKLATLLNDDRFLWKEDSSAIEKECKK